MIEVNNNIENTNNTENIESTKGERLKNIRYANERKDLTKKLLQLLGITSSNKIFDSYTLDHNLELQKSIINLVPLIEKYFSVAKWSYHKGKKNKLYLSISKSLLKEMNIHFISHNKKKKVDDQFVPYVAYNITCDISTYLV